MDINNCFETISGKTNNPEIERGFREACLLYESQLFASNSPLSEERQKLVDLYHRCTSLYLTHPLENGTKLTIYNTENEIEEERILETSEPSYNSSIALLPNGELFLFDNILVDQNFNIRTLPSSSEPCAFGSCIYFNNSVYCFGGEGEEGPLSLSRKFDFNENRWINLTPMPIWDSCHCALFNGIILISGSYSSNLLIYSIEDDSFSTIPFEFAEYHRKILINAGKLYLIECEGLIYESEDEYNWKQISNSIISDGVNQIYYAYNKGGIYIAASMDDVKYFKFDLNQKVMTELNKRESQLMPEQRDL